MLSAARAGTDSARVDPTRSPRRLDALITVAPAVWAARDEICHRLLRENLEPGAQMNLPGLPVWFFNCTSGRTAHLWSCLERAWSVALHSHLRGVMLKSISSVRRGIHARREVVAPRSV